MAARILLLSIRQARMSPAVCELPRTLQDVVLSHTWSQLFLLQAVSWPLLLSADCDITHLLLACRQLAPDPIEISMLQTLVLCRNGIMLMDEVVQREMSSCYYYTQISLTHHTSIARYSTLLMIMPALHSVPAATVRALLLNPVIGSVPIQHIIPVI
ncbi:Retinal guanylyl cyclase 1 [Homalodisca vitripennis]|nr:Retinal guanylyl cyclase 1 [Homalodisca vitripennis]